MPSGCHIGRQKGSFPLLSVLSSAVFEWLLMLLLFLNAFYSFLITKFARYCELQTPCLMCSRLDHIFGDGEPGFYWGLICGSHKSEISSLSYCDVNHAKGNEMCEGRNEVKVTSDSESENPFSDDADGNHLAQDLKEDHGDRCLSSEHAAMIPDNLSMPLSECTAMDKLIQPTASEPESSLPIKGDQLVHVHEARDASFASTDAVTNDTDETNWNKNVSQKDASEFSDVKLNGSKNCSESASTISTSQITRDTVPSVPIQMDLDDAYKLATNSKGSLRSTTVSEVITGRDSSRAYEDLRILISQFSAARGLDSPWRELTPSPRVQGQGDDLKFFDASSSVILQNITKRLSIDINESGFESLDGSIVGEIEGESPIDRLKRQVELDRKSMHLLYKELEEERSASAVAANQALAMITRLQEEKAAIRMEALQYQRMMEEQAEYDQEVLQYSNELLAKREREIQDVEAELESCKKGFGNKIVGDSVLETSGDAKATEYERKISQVSDKFDQRKSDIYGNLLIGFEDEKSYISDRLKNLERRLNLFSNSGMWVDVSSAATEEDGYLGISYRDESVEKNRREALIPSDSNNADEYLNRTSSNLAALLNEVSRLNERLTDLEADSGFLENIVNTLRNGYDGVQYIQEIACHLQELRKIGITLREHNVA